MTKLDALGLFAGMLTTFAYFPQVVRTWKTRSTDDLSLAMLVLLVVGILIWTVYGMLIASIPLIVSNTVTLVFVLFILAVKIQNLRKKP